MKVWVLASKIVLESLHHQLQMIHSEPEPLVHLHCPLHHQVGTVAEEKGNLMTKETIHLAGSLNQKRLQMA